MLPYCSYKVIFSWSWGVRSFHQDRSRIISDHPVFSLSARDYCCLVNAGLFYADSVRKMRKSEHV